MAKFRIVEEKRKVGTAVIVRTSFRDGTKKSTSRNVGIIGIKEDLVKKFPKINDYEKMIKEKANDMFENRKTDNLSNIIFKFDKNNEVNENRRCKSAQLYLLKLWNDLNIKTKLDSLKGESKSKYKFDLNEIAFYLVSSQLLNPNSKKYCYEKADLLPIKPTCSLDDVYRSLTVLYNHMDEINAYIYKKASKYLDLNSKIYFYDVTNFTFTQGSDNPLIGLKKSKEGIYGPLIQMGLLMDEYGLLLGFIVFKGNDSEQQSLKEQISKISPKINLNNVVFCTDAGLCSYANKEMCSKNNRAYITTQSIKGRAVSKKVQDWCLEDKNFKDSSGNNITIKELFNEYNQAVESNNRQKINDILEKTIYKSAWVAIENSKTKKDDKILKILGKKNGKTQFEQRLIVSFNLKYFFSQKKKLEENIEIVKRAIDENKDLTINNSKNSPSNYLNTVSITNNGEVADEKILSLNQEKILEEQKFFGYYCVATNLEDKVKDIISVCRTRYQIEYCFRTLKTNFKAHPIRLSRPEHINGHFVICGLTLMLFKTMMYKIYHHIGWNKTHLGRPENNDYQFLTQDSLIDTLQNLESIKITDTLGNQILLSSSKETKITDLLKETFKFSLTKEAINLDELIKKINK